MIRTLFKPDWRVVWRDAQFPESASIYTRPEVVSLILDLAGYAAGSFPLIERRLLEPSCGDGAFLCEILRRLLGDEALRGGNYPWQDPRWDRAITAVDLSPKAIQASREVIHECLLGAGCPRGRAGELAKRWAFQADFLLHDWGDDRFDIVVGNPPYIRVEEIPTSVCLEYRALWSTATDRADVYVPFFECGLSLLSDAGTLAFICANRFAKNHYGSALRRLIADRYHVRHYVNLEHTQPFLSVVSAYPAVIVLDRNRGEPTHAETVVDLEPSTLRRLRDPLVAGEGENHFPAWYPDGSAWISTSKSRHASLEALARDYPTIEASAPGTRIGIGIATGADDVFVLPIKSPAIEESRQVPLLLAGDISSRGVNSSSAMLVNPFADTGDGSLVDLADYPGLSRYLAQYRNRLGRRHCVIRRPDQWYRTIDRYWPGLTMKPKLVIPDIQPGGIIGYEGGRSYPHHNVYWITSDTWDLRELQRVLQSEVVTDQVRAFSVAMRGGSLRYQVQTLRKVRVPYPGQSSSLFAGPLSSRCDAGG